MCPGPVITKDVAAAATDAAAVDAQRRDAEQEEESPKDRVLSAGLFPPEERPEEEDEQRHHYEEPQTRSTASAPPVIPQASTSADSGEAGSEEKTTSNYGMDETLFVFDWDDTLLPSTWLQRQGLRLDDGSKVSEWHREQLDVVSSSAVQLIGNAKQCGTVVLVTNAERGWIELSCQKFLPTLAPLLENVKAVSARTSFESRNVSSPLEWKLRAFEKEISTVYGQDTLQCPQSRKNVLSLGDSVHEREALMRATAQLPNCHAKSLKFCERPDISQICKQHSLVNSCFDRVVHHDGHLDLCIKCT